MASTVKNGKITRLQNSPKIGVLERVLVRGREMGEPGEEGIARPGEKGNGEERRKEGIEFGPNRGCFAI